MRRPTLTVSLPSFGSPPGDDWASLLDLARQAEAAGVDRVMLSDHVVMGRNTHEYAWDRFPAPRDAPWLEPLTVVTAMAAVTQRVRISTGILIAPLRPAAVLAKAAATLDVLSGGRLDLGVGTGWQREEYEACGLNFDRRGQLLTDTMTACRALWEHTPATFDSPSLSFEEIFCQPRPAQDRLPVWFSGVLHGRNQRRVVELGDGWIPIMGATLDDVRDGTNRLRAAFADRGRSADALVILGAPPMQRAGNRHGDVAATMTGVPDLLDAGATDIYVHLRAFTPKLDHVDETLTELVEEFTAVTSRA